MAEGLLQKRAATTGGRLQPIEKDEVKPRPKTHYPFITKIQVTVKKDETENESTSKHDKNSTIQAHSVRPTTFTYRDPPVTRSSSTNSFYEEESSFVPRRESLDELRRQRRKILGERASAMDGRRGNDSLYRPRFSAKDCTVQLLLVRELTEHLESVGRETRSARRLQRLPAFHSHATKGERVFGVNKWKY